LRRNDSANGSPWWWKLNGGLHRTKLEDAEVRC
jgi:hypothetical protein